MKVTDPDVIKTGERELIDAVKNDLDWNAVKEIVKKRIDLSALQSKGGEIVIHNNQIAFRIDLGLTLDVSLMFDRQGNYIQDEDGPEELLEKVSEPADSGSDLPLPDIAPETQSEPITDDEKEWAGDIDAAMDSLDLGADTQDGADAGEDLLDLNIETQDLEEDAGKDPLDMDFEDTDLGDDVAEDVLDKALADDALDLGELSDDESELDLEEISLADQDGEEETLDDDIDQILKESREFWGQKKDE